MKNIVIYTSPTCIYCERTKELLGSLNLPYENIDIEVNPKERLRLIQDYGYMTVPAIFIDEELIGGYDDLVQMNSEGKLK